MIRVQSTVQLTAKMQGVTRLCFVKEGMLGRFIWREWALDSPIALLNSLFDLTLSQVPL
jgi:hypothetical protein